MLPVFFSPFYEADFGVHVFPTSKYRVVLDHLIRLGITDRLSIEEPQEATEEVLLLVHDREYLDDFLTCRWTDRTSRSELPLTAEIVRMFRLAAGGTLLAARRAVESGVAYHCGGGFHHAFAGHAEGFCYINDIAVALRVLLREGRIRRPVVIDCDLHQGNGTARIFQNEPDVFTFSIHEENNYPEKEQSDLDIGLESFVGDEGYLRALSTAIPSIYDRHRADFLLYVAGADPFEDDQLGYLKITRDGLRRRDDLVLGAASERGIPAAIVLAGGYARQLEDTVAIHVGTALSATESLAAFRRTTP